MVLGILIAAITAPGLLGSQEAIRQGQSKDKREEHRARRCNLIASCVKSSPRSREIDGRPVVLRNGKLWIDTTTKDGEPFGHTYAGYYLPYPDTKYEGLVTTITDVAPIMNWVYIDRETYEAKYGVRADAQPNLTGPFDCTRQDRRLTFDGWEGWCAVEEYDGYWCLYFDIDDDGLKSKVALGTRVLEVELSRKEKRFKKEQETRQQDQTTKRAVDTQEDAPVDRPLQPDPEIRRPGVFDEIPTEPETTPVGDATPKTPPPAYSKTDEPTILSTERTKEGAIGALDDLLAMEVQATAPIKDASPDETSTPSPKRAPLGEKRITPRLNRNSGSKAIAQAQKFEAMAAAQKDDTQTRNTPSDKRVSITSSLADSASFYSEDEQGSSREVRPQSSVSQRALYQSLDAPPVPSTSSREPHEKVDKMVSLQKSVPRVVQRDTQFADPAVFGPSASSNDKRRSQASSSSQRKRNSRTLTARRPGKRVSPRNSYRKSLTDTMSSGAEKQRLATSNTSFRLPGGRGKTVNRTKSGRKTTSTFLRDLDDLVSQEVVPEIPKSGGTSPVLGKGLLARGEQQGSKRRADKGSRFRT
jgi:hypothetical protein